MQNDKTEVLIQTIHSANSFGSFSSSINSVAEDGLIHSASFHIRKKKKVNHIKPLFSALIFYFFDPFHNYHILQLKLGYVFYAFSV